MWGAALEAAPRRLVSAVAARSPERVRGLEYILRPVGVDSVRSLGLGLILRPVESVNGNALLPHGLVKIGLYARSLAKHGFDRTKFGYFLVAGEGGFLAAAIKAESDNRHTFARGPCCRDGIGPLALPGRHKRHVRNARLDFGQLRPEGFPFLPYGGAGKDDNRALRMVLFPLGEGAFPQEINRADIACGRYG